MNETQQPDEIDAHAGGATSSPKEHDGLVFGWNNSTPLKDIAASEKKFSPYYCSSIGPAESKVIPDRIYKDNDKVTKNFCTEVKTSVDAVVDVFTQIESHTLAEGARLNIRFITTLDNLADAIKETNWKQYIEGITPLAGCGVDELEGMCIINLGRNDLKRIFDENVFNKLLGEAQQIYEKGNGATNGHVLPDGYEYRTLDNTSGDELKEKVMHLLVSFAWNEDEARAIIDSPDVKIGLMIHKETGEVASLIGIESRKIVLKVNGKEVELKVQEVAEAKSAPGHTGKGLYGYVNTEIMRQIVEAGEAPNILIGEVNLHSRNHAVVRNAFVLQHRKCGIMDMEIRNKLGMDRPSALRADFTIKGSINGNNNDDDTLTDTQANSLLVTYQTMKMLLSTYGKEPK